MSDAAKATVWAATWVPSPPPIADVEGDGFAVAWVDVEGGSRVQAFVVGSSEPAIGTSGAVHHDADLDVAVFVPDEAVS